jgi:putative oxidoreductase
MLRGASVFGASRFGKSTLMESAMNAFPGAVGDSASSSAAVKKSKGTLENLTELAGRVLLAAPFLLSGLGKLGAYSATADYMSSVGVPGALLPAVIGTEVIGALAIILGWKTRTVAVLLAGFSVLTAIVFHHTFADQMQMTEFLKNVSIAGGFLLLVAKGVGPLSIYRHFA